MKWMRLALAALGVVLAIRQLVRRYGELSDES